MATTEQPLGAGVYERPPQLEDFRGVIRQIADEPANEIQRVVIARSMA